MMRGFLLLAASLVAGATSAVALGGAMVMAAAFDPADVLVVADVAAPDLVTSPVAGTVTVDRAAFVMGTPMTLSVEGADRGSALAASEAALEAVERAEARLSTWRDDTELARLNRTAAGESFRPSAELATELRAAVECSALT